MKGIEIIKQKNGISENENRTLSVRSAFTACVASAFILWIMQYKDNILRSGKNMTNIMFC